jgi:SsrA-binding protein
MPRVFSTQQMTLVPLSAYFNEKNMLKLKLGLGRGKNLRDKRSDIEKRDSGRELQRAFKNIRAST